MNDLEQLQPLIHRGGDVESMIREMKRRAGVETDVQLAAAIGRTQGAISHWRRKGHVPEGVLLGFEDLVARHRGNASARAMAARAIAIRLAEYMYQQNSKRSPNAGRWIPYMTVAMGFHSITDAVFASLESLEDGRSPTELAEVILEDEGYLAKLAEWARSISLAQAISREAKSPPSIPDLPTLGPQ